MRFTSLGSGSEGNALVIEVADGVSTTRVLLDCGFSVRELQRRLLRAGLDFADLDAVLVTHEHTDHVGSSLTLAKKANLPVFMSWGTALASGADDGRVDLRILWAAIRSRSATSKSIRIQSRTMRANPFNLSSPTAIVVSGS